MALSVSALAAADGLPTQSGSFTLVAEDGLGRLEIRADQAFFDGGSPGNAAPETNDDVVQAGGAALIFDSQNGGFQPGMYVIEGGVVKITFDSISGPDANGEYEVFVTATLLDSMNHGVGTSTDDQITLQVAVDVADVDGDTATAFYNAVVIDDTAEAKADADTTDTLGDAAGNVIDGTGMVSGVADIAGADGLDDPAVVGVSTSSGSLTDNTGVGTVVASAKGELTLAADGSFTYDRTDDTATGTDVF
ncbi:MAG: hypothetical protein GY758_00180, partial [Fuerstiella sp.]|nr:hypothetical protein [Fuerstiella sp.]